MTPRLQLLLIALGCTALGIACYWNTLDAKFVWDDRAAVLWNADLRNSTPWSTLLHHDFWGQDITVE